MTDTLRDRIAALVAPHADYVSNGIRYCSCGWCGDSQGTRMGFAAHVADEVIAALDSRGWMIDPESGDRRRRRENARWLKGEDG